MYSEIGGNLVKESSGLALSVRAIVDRPQDEQFFVIVHTATMHLGSCSTKAILRIRPFLRRDQGYELPDPLLRVKEPPPMLKEAVHLGIDLAVNYGPNFHLHLQVGAWAPVAVLIALWKEGGPPGDGPGRFRNVMHTIAVILTRSTISK
jgi:hypothetical protein